MDLMSSPSCVTVLQMQGAGSRWAGTQGDIGPRCTIEHWGPLRLHEGTPFDTESMGRLAHFGLVWILITSLTDFTRICISQCPHIDLSGKTVQNELPYLSCS